MESVCRQTSPILCHDGYETRDDIKFYNNCDMNEGRNHHYHQHYRYVNDPRETSSCQRPMTNHPTSSRGNNTLNMTINGFRPDDVPLQRRVVAKYLMSYMNRGLEGKRYQVMDVSLRKNSRGLGMSITGGIESIKGQTTSVQPPPNDVLSLPVQSCQVTTTGRSSPSSSIVMSFSPSSNQSFSQPRTESTPSRLSSVSFSSTSESGSSHVQIPSPFSSSISSTYSPTSTPSPLLDKEGGLTSSSSPVKRLLDERRRSERSEEERSQRRKIHGENGEDKEEKEEVSQKEDQDVSSPSIMHASCALRIVPTERRLDRVVVGGGGEGQSSSTVDSVFDEEEFLLKEKLISIKKVFPSEPASQAGLLAGDIILEANALNMVGLTNVEAVNLFHSFKDEVKMSVLRFLLNPVSDSNRNINFQSPTSSISVTSSSGLEKDSCQPSESRHQEEQVKDTPNSRHLIRNELRLTPTSSPQDMVMSTPSPVKDAFEENLLLEEPPNRNPPDFEVSLKKKDGSLGFTIVKKDDGIYVKDIIKDPALNDGRINAGDKILRVNGIDVSSLSHSGAISFLRGLPDVVKLKIHPYVSDDLNGHDMSYSALSSDGYSSISKKQLRHEARMMIKDKGNCDSLSRLKMRKDKSKRDASDHKMQDDSQADNQKTNPTITLTTKPDNYWHETNNVANEGISPSLTTHQLKKSQSSDETLFTKVLMTPDVYSQTTDVNHHRKGKPQRVESGSSVSDPHRPSEDSPDSASMKPLRKWRGQNLVDHLQQDPRFLDEQDSGFGDSTPKATLEKPLTKSIVEVTLQKGWTSRLGIQLMDNPSTEPPFCCVVKGIVPHTIASHDGRIKEGFKLLSVNDMTLDGKPSKEVIDYMRKFKGKLHMKFLTP